MVTCLRMGKSCPEFVERCTQLKDLDGSRQLLRSYRASRKFFNGLKQLSRSCRECDKKQLKGLDRQPSCREVSRSCRDYLKKKISRREKHRHECNQACYTTKNLNNILSSQNHLNKKTVKHIDLKHTHTLNKSNQFYISKTSYDSLMSIH